MRRPSERGFTLIEMMVVVAIIGILVTLTIMVTGKTYGGNTASVSDKIVSAMGMTKMRSVSTRRIHQVEFKPQEIDIWQATTTGFGTPAGWALVEKIDIPNGVTIWDVNPAVLTATGNSVSQTAGLDYTMNFKPDGSSAGATVFVTDRENVSSYRVLIYKATGSSYAHETW